MRKYTLLYLLVVWFVALSAAPGLARVVRVEITGSEPFVSKAYTGAYGPYELVTGRVYHEVDPADPLNTPIVDLDKAPRNAKGLVEFSADLQILKPIDTAKGSRRLLYIVVNRGRPNNDFNDLLANRGYTIVWSGWQGNVEPTTDPKTGKRSNYANDFPRGKNADGSTITGQVYNTFYVAPFDVEPAKASLPLTYDRGFTYKKIEAVSTDNADATLWTHEYPYAARVLVPKHKWAFARAKADGSRGEPSANDVWLEGGFQPGLGYEIVYTGKDPLVNGLSFAAVRDLISFLKNEPGAGNPVAVPGGMIAAFGYGKSQSGRFLRVLTYLGFNEDEAHRKVFDGIYADAPGGSQGSFNFRFCNPGRVTSPDIDLYQLTDYPPSTFTVTTDPYTRVTGSLLDRARAKGVLPKFFQIQTAAEYWTRSGSLAHLLPDLSGDQEFPNEVRYYHISSTQHVPSTAAFTTPLRQLPSNTNNFKPVIDALLIALDEWVTQNVAPPPSTLPTLRDQTMADWRQQASGFPAIPGVNYPGWVHEPPIFDDRTMEKGVVTVWPLRTVSPRTFYPAYVPKVDADGNEIAGIRTPDIACPIGTYTGWTLYKGQYGTGTPMRNMGSFIPFTPTKADREVTGDPRLSLEERYTTHAAYVQCVKDAAEAAAKARLILPEEIANYIQTAEKRSVPK
jgi:hypothetical protein